MDKTDKNRAVENDTGQASIKLVYGEDPRDDREVASEANEAFIEIERSAREGKKRK